MSVSLQKPEEHASQERTKKERKHEPKDIYEEGRQSVKKYFKKIQKSTSSYLQSVTNLQQELIALRNNTLNSAISLQEEFAKSVGMKEALPEGSTKIMTFFEEQVMKANSLQDQIILTTLDMVRKNIKTFNENEKTFEEINARIIQSYTSLFFKTSQ